MITCRMCGVEKQEACFSPEPRNKSGRLYQCIECRNEKSRIHSKSEHRKAYRAAWKEKNKEKLRAQNAAYWQANKERLSKIIKEWNKSHPEFWRAHYRKLHKKRNADPVYNMHSRISRQFRQALGNDKWRGVDKFKMLGYTPEDLIRHLERQFTNGMSWENRSEWHIDHIIPLNSFDFSGPDDPNLKKAWALSNLRPLWKQENIRKKDRIEFLL